MKILVTGASGFIGRHVIQNLIDLKEHEVIATSLSKDEVKDFEWADRIKFIECDLNNTNDNYFNFFGKPDILIHLSWQGLPNYNELFHIERNLFSNYSFLKNMTANGLNDITIIGTCLEYGLKEGCLKETLNTEPVNPYGVAKDTLRKFVDELKKVFDFDYKWIRLFYMYGKGQSKTSILSQLETSIKNNEETFNMSEGEQLRDYLPVEKVAENIVRISLQKKITGIINCCSGKPISIRKLVEEYLRDNKKEIKLNPGYYPYADYEPMAFWGDNTKLLKVIS